ncbi:MAG: hypothetical protein JST54_22830 [Deltaproteobacteria bacterium]|nr:hypothetical protein [Deltaproteobacteria bacterium]
MAGSRHLGIVLLGLTGCALFGKSAAKGTLQAAQETKAETGVAPTEVIANNVTKGALEMLTQPPQLERQRLLAGTLSLGAIDALLAPRSGAEVGGQPGAIHATAFEQLGDQFGNAFAASLGRQLILVLGPEGNGPLARSVAATTEHATEGAARGIDEAASHFADRCQGKDRQTCMDQLVGSASRTAGAGFMEGAMAALRWPLLLGAFLLGVLVALLFAVLMLGLRRRWEAPPTTSS